MSELRTCKNSLCQWPGVEKDDERCPMCSADVSGQYAGLYPFEKEAKKIYDDCIKQVEAARRHEESERKRQAQKKVEEENIRQQKKKRQLVILGLVSLFVFAFIWYAFSVISSIITERGPMPPLAERLENSEVRSLRVQAETITDPIPGNLLVAETAQINGRILLTFHTQGFEITTELPRILPRVSPNQEQIAYIDRAENGRRQVFIYELVDQSIELLPPPVDNVEVEAQELIWSPDGNTLVVVYRRLTADDNYMLALYTAGEWSSEETIGQNYGSGLAWLETPTTSYISYFVGKKGQVKSLVWRNTASLSLEADMPMSEDLTNLYMGGADYTPDGSYLALTAREQSAGVGQLYVLDLNSRDVTLRTPNISVVHSLSPVNWVTASQLLYLNEQGALRMLNLEEQERTDALLSNYSASYIGFDHIP